MMAKASDSLMVDGDENEVVADLRQRAAARAPTSYAGDLLVDEAWSLLSQAPDALLVDVRTQPEWIFAGVPDLRELDKEVICLSWQFYPDFSLNMQFLEQMSQIVPSTETPLAFLCRTGGRSAAAAEAMTQAGFSACFNIIDGFDGPHDDRKRRGVRAGWRAEGKPWRQQ